MIKKKGRQMNNIINFLCLPDNDIEVTNIEISGDTKYVYIRKILTPMFCPNCNYRMHSKGIRKRSIRHPIFQDGYKLVLVVSVRRWECQNDECDGYIVDNFSFFDKGKQLSNLTPFMVLEALKDLNRTAVSVAEQFHISDTLVHTYVLTYLDFKRLPMPRILSIDEVYLEFNKSNRYCLVLIDFETGGIVDILPNRNGQTMEDYFLAIPREERLKTEIIITDMYGPYLNLPNKYFNKANCIVDSFHVVSFLVRSINNYINEVQKRYQAIDNQRRKEKNIQNNTYNKTIKDSDEVKLLKSYRFFLLKNNDEIEYSSYRYFRKRFGAYLNTQELEKKFIELDDKFETIRDLKEEYIAFNSEYFGKDENEVRSKLEELINKYQESDIKIFIDFANHLKHFKEQIILSFKDFGVPVKDKEREDLHRRLSNGPMEGFNLKPKNLKRNSRGLDNFEYTRNRILWSEREDAHILAIPKSEKEVHTYTYKTRGPYNKNK